MSRVKIPPQAVVLALQDHIIVNGQRVKVANPAQGVIGYLPVYIDPDCAASDFPTAEIMRVHIRAPGGKI